jgi:hypothetical protein
MDTELLKFKQIQSKIKCILEVESNSSELLRSVTRKNKYVLTIFGKPTDTDNIIYKDV